ncbi:MAG: DNA polymerase IV, partial [Actinobacteria bacterium]|nr:DNA polymerase IV [Actinomycetota bacterium]
MFDSFFASCEQQFNPLFRNKPLGVIATNSRSCIVAASREAKRFGIKTGMRSFEAKKVYPSIIFVPASFVKYFEVSKIFLDICKDYSPYVELFSIDEVFIDVTKTEHLFGGTHEIIKIIKKRIKQEIGEYITASFGISYNKLLAKLASGLKKPNGLAEI